MSPREADGTTLGRLIDGYQIPEWYRALFEAAELRLERVAATRSVTSFLDARR